jgi:hypothetical protein
VYILRLATQHISPDLHAGGCFASAVEQTRKAYYEGGLSTSAATESGLEHFTREWGDYDPPHRHDGSSHNKSYVNTAAAFIDYWREYDPRFDRLKPYRNRDGSIATEYSFAIPTSVMHPTSGEPIVYVGRFDMLGYFEGEPSNLYIVDEKTTGSLGAQWGQKWNMRGQFLGYAYAARDAGFRVQGAIVRGVAIKKTSTDFAQALISLPNWQIDRYWEQLQDDIARMVEHWDNERAVPHSFPLAFGEACEQYGGCSYLDLCTAEYPERWYGDYVERMWNPLAADPTKEPAL